MLRCLTVVILAVLIGGGVLAYQAIGGASSPAPKPAASAVPTMTPSPQAAASFDQKLSAFEKSAAAGGQKPIELVLTQQEIASKIQHSLASRGSGEISNVGVQLQEGGAVITGNTSVAGATVPVEATAQLSAAGGMLGVNVTSVKTANVELPQAIRDQLLQRVQQAVGLNDLQKIDVGINVQSVQVTSTQVRISGQTR